jgi:hypothetical protein
MYLEQHVDINGGAKKAKKDIFLQTLEVPRVVGYPGDPLFVTEEFVDIATVENEYGGKTLTVDHLAYYDTEYHSQLKFYQTFPNNTAAVILARYLSLGWNEIP